MERAVLVFVPSPGGGHLVPAVELAKLLVDRDDRLSVAILVTRISFDSAISAYLDSAKEARTDRIRVIDLPMPDPLPKPTSTSPLSLLSAFVESQKENVHYAVAALAECESLAGFVVDMFCTAMADVADEFHVPAYLFFPGSAAYLGFMLQVQSLADGQGLDVNDYKNAALAVPTFFNPVPGKVFPRALGIPDDFSAYLSSARKFRGSRGIIVNTFSELESHAVGSFRRTNLPPVYAVGPVLDLRRRGERERGEEILRWLEDQPVASVVFLCFGSMGAFGEDQVKEIAIALENSGLRFLWSLRRGRPRWGERIFSPREYENLADVLPGGFLDRTSDRGRVIGWAPQAEVLSHAAVGGFVSHCGWNSILESVWCGVPLAAWPIYAEQQVNAFNLVVELGLAVEIKMDYKKDAFGTEEPPLVTAEEIQIGLQKLMDGDSEIRKKAREWSEKGRSAVMEGGSSYTYLGNLILDIIGEGEVK